VDLAFIIDSSSSVFPNDFVRQLEFVENITDELDVGILANQSRVAVISFSDKPKIEFSFNDYTEKVDVVSAIRRIDYLSGGTNTSAAIDLAVHRIFKEENGARVEAEDAIVVITDGESFSENETRESAWKARSVAIVMYAIGVGPDVNTNELRLITGNSDHVYQVSSYDDLRSIADVLMNETCVGLYYPCTCI
jgi:collagen type VI alpha